MSTHMDNAASRMIDEAVVRAMQPFLEEQFGNPDSVYYTGTTAEEAVRNARANVAALVDAEDDEIHFVSGGTEGNNWVLRCCQPTETRSRIITSAVEDESVSKTLEALAAQGRTVTILPVDEYGLVTEEALEAELGEDVLLVSVQTASGETGTVQPISELVAVAHGAGALFHTDAVQVVGKLGLSVSALGLDFLTMSANAFHGPKGIGAVYVREGLQLTDLLYGTIEMDGVRAGTTNVALVVGMGKAAELASAGMAEEAARQHKMIDTLFANLSDYIDGLLRNGHAEQRVPGTLAVMIPGVDAQTVVAEMNKRYGMSIRALSKAGAPSATLLAMGLTEEQALSSVRISVSKHVSESDCLDLADFMGPLVEELASEEA